LFEVKELRGGVAERKDDLQRDASARDGRTARTAADRGLGNRLSGNRIAVNPMNRDAACI
jgi:hypothetical protein